MDKNITVIKRDGTKEPYNEQKIYEVVKSAGLEDSKAQEFAKKITSLLPNKKEIDSSQIREIVLENLKKMDQYAAGLYAWYEKTKEKNS